jgi:hypothetical protein
MKSHLNSALFAASKSCLLALTAIGAMLASSPVHASAFNFSFTEAPGSPNNIDTGNTNGTVTGEIVLDPTNTFATHVFINSYPTGPTGLPLGISAPFDALANADLISGNDLYTVDSSGNLTSEHFNVSSSSNNFEIRLEAQDFELGTNNSSLIVASDVATFTPVITPLPAALPLFATGIGALGLLGWRRKRKAQAAA